MVYKKLLLSEGGGIISPFQQVEQSNDTVNILIGLGGTGIDCIRSIKTQVHNRIKPDGIDADGYKYSRIRFLGVDSDIHSCGNNVYASGKNENLQLADDEFLFIGVKNIPMPLMKNPELSWFNYKNINIPSHRGTGAGGIRQVGRFLLMERSEAFANKVEKEIRAAKSGLSNLRVNVHIFAGLSGGTGSGCFLDVCYMVRSIAERIGGVTMLGYFFLPDVLLTKVPYQAVSARSFIAKNGYAAMQELDYCMSLPENGGSFEQEYQEKRIISWNLRPVDVCYVVSATDTNGHIHGYSYIIDATTEHIMQLLAKSDSIAKFLGAFKPVDFEKTMGAQMSYCSIGGICASIPLKEINTYLASELFSRFAAIQRNIPSQADVVRLAISSLARDAQSINTIYDSLYREIREDATGEYGQYQDDWKFVRDYGNSEMVTHYTNQTAAQLNKAETNAKSMVSMANQYSLLSRIQTQLFDVLRDINRGPIFAYRMIAASESHNLLNIVDGLIDDNNSRWNQEAAQTDLRQSDYDNAKADFDDRRKRSFFDNDEKRFNDYEYYLMLLEQHKLNMHVFSKLDSVLRELRNQIVEITASYYIKLNRVMDTLINTFAENRDALASEKILDTSGSFAIPMMTIAELKKSLDTEIERINVPGMLDAFMVLLVQNEDEWIQEDENKISRMVTDFFVNTAFNGFANKTITSFLKDKYENKYGGRITDEQLAGFIYNDWMKLLTENATRLFGFNKAIWSENKTAMNPYITFPAISIPIRMAAVQMKQRAPIWNLKESLLTDRIYVTHNMMGFPLSSYIYCADYEYMCFSAKEYGRHYYEGKPLRGIGFTDWNELPSITPQSVIDMANIPEDLALRIRESNDLYERALSKGVLDDTGTLYEADKAHLIKISNACDECEALITNARSIHDESEIRQKIELLLSLLKIPMVKVKKVLPSDGDRWNQESILAVQKDYFFASPILHDTVRENVEVIERLMKKTDSIIKKY